MLKHKDGTAMKYADFRIIEKSPAILNGPYAVLEDMPADLKSAIKTAFFEAPTKAKVEFERLSDGKNKGFKALFDVSHASMA